MWEGDIWLEKEKKRKKSHGQERVIKLTAKKEGSERLEDLPEAPGLLSW